MSDPLSLVGIIAAIIALADEVVMRGLGLYQSIKGCPKEVKDLMDEIRSLGGVLSELKYQAMPLQTASSARIAASQSSPNSPLANYRQTLKMTENLLKKLEMKPDEAIRNAAKRVHWIFKKEDVDGLMVRLERHKTSFLLALQLGEMESIEQLMVGNAEALQQISDSKAEVLQGLGKIEDYQISRQAAEEQRRKDDRRDVVLRWLSSFNFHLKHSILQGDRSAGTGGCTGGWFLESAEFVSWLEQQDPIVMLCQGSPGVGKTYLASIVVDHLKLKFPGGDVGIAYIYCGFDQRANQTPNMILASILQQLAYKRPGLSPHVHSLYENVRAKGEYHRPGLADLHSAILAVSKEFSMVYLVLDALDECDEETQRKDLLIALDQLSQALLKIFVTSRPHPMDIQNAFREAQVVNVHAHDNDIERFVISKIEQARSREITIRESIAKDIVKRVIPSAKEIFLVAAFQVKLILEQKTQKRMKKAAESLTAGLNSTYDRIMDTIDRLPGVGRDEALKILTWISMSARPLHVTELQVAVSIEDGDSEVDADAFLDAKTIVDYCGGLVTIEQKTGIARFVHYTVQEYLLGLNLITPTNAHSRIARTCLTYFSFGVPNRDTWSPQNLSGESSFRNYAASSWGFHMRALNEPSDLIQKASDLFQSTHFVSELNSFGWPVIYSFPPRPSQPIHIAAASGLVSLVRLLLDSKDINPDSKDSIGMTPLSYAAQHGHEGVVRLLLDRVDVTPDSKDRFGMTPLSCAAHDGHEGVVRLLVDQADVDPDSKDDAGMTPLTHAAQHGHEGVVRLLVDRADVNPDSKNYFGMTPLALAARHGHEGVVILLVDRADVNPDSKNYFGMTPLALAARHGYEGVVRLLVDRANVNPDSKSNSGMTPLSYAAQHGYERVVRLLVDRADVNPDSSDDSGGAPLIWAAKLKQEAVVEMLKVRIEAKHSLS